MLWRLGLGLTLLILASVGASSPPHTAVHEAVLSHDRSGDFVIIHSPLNPPTIDTSLPLTLPRASPVDASLSLLSPPDASSSSSPTNATTSSPHSWHAMQAAGTSFDMVRLSAAAPFSVRTQPGLMYRTREVQYTQVGSGLRVRLGAGYLLLYEGAMTNRTGPDTLYMENDVWISNDDGATWDLIAGRSEYGRSGPISAVRAYTFVGRAWSNNCNDPLSDLTLSIGGWNPATQDSTAVVYTSFDGLSWLQSPAAFSPGRRFSSCDISDRGDVFVIGGHFSAANVAQDRLLNDIWRGSGGATITIPIPAKYTKVTDAAPFAAREEHLVLVGYSAGLKREVLYVIGGKVSCLSTDCYDGRMSNDVWASSDSGDSWAAITASAPFGPRWGHGGWVTRDGVLLVWGGLNTATGLYADTVTQRDMWASFDGGYTWAQCATSGTSWIRGEQGVAVNRQGQMVLVGGYAYAENGDFQVRYNDVWRSAFSVENTTALAVRCGGRSRIPAAGVGLRVWPGRPVVPANTLTFTAVTLRAPWSPRIRPGLLLMSEPVTYRTADGMAASTGRDWLMFYGGMYSLGSVPGSVFDENDVYGSADNGTSWRLMSGIAHRGQMGSIESASAQSSFSATVAEANCEDPLSDDVYVIAGIRYNTSYPAGTGAGFLGTNEVWWSPNALQWTRRTGRTFDPPRSGAACDVGHSHNLLVVGGRASYPGVLPTQQLLNDVWASTNRGQTWTRTTARAPFPARSEHTMQIARSERYNVDLVFVVGGGIFTGGVADTLLNDVWVSSSGGSTWMQVQRAATWSQRWGHSVVITSAGAMVLVGSSGVLSDVWASFNGGARWTQCQLQAGQTVTENSPAVQLTADERLIVGSGYPRTDLWLSDQSLSDPQRLARMCQGSIPETGVGLYVESWTRVPSAGADSSSGGDMPAPPPSTGLSAGVAVLIVLAVAVGAAVLYALWRRYAQKEGSCGGLAQVGGDSGGQLETGETAEGVAAHSALDRALLRDTAAGQQ